MSITIVHLTYVYSSRVTLKKKITDIPGPVPSREKTGKSLTFFTVQHETKSFTERNGQLYLCPVVGVLDEPYSAKPAQRSSHTGPPGYIGWTLFQPM
jgi:hypothetical protein